MSEESPPSTGRPELLDAYLELIQQRFDTTSEHQLEKARLLGAKLINEADPASTMANWQKVAVARFFESGSDIHKTEMLAPIGAIHAAAAAGFDAAYREKLAQISLVEEQVVRSQRMEAIGQLAGGVQEGAANEFMIGATFCRL